MDLQPLRDIIELKAKKKALEDELKGVDAEIKEKEAQIVATYSEEGVQRMTVDGKTIYTSGVTTVKAAEGVSYHDIAKALEDLGLGEMVTVNHRTFGSYASEQMKLYLAENPDIDQNAFDPKEALPVALRDLVTVDKTVRVSVTKAA